MTPRNGLYVAFIGLVMAVPCFAALFLVQNWNPDADELITIANLGLVCLALGVMLGLIVMAVGLILAGVLAFTKQAGNPYRHAATTYSAQEQPTKAVSEQLLAHRTTDLTLI